MTKETLEYRYGAVSPARALLMIGVCLVTVGALVHLATGDPQSVRRLGRLAISSGFMWLLAGAMVVCTLAAIAFSLHSVRGPRFVQLTASHATVPSAGLWGGKLAIAYSSINDILKKSNGKHKVVTIHSRMGTGKVIASHFHGPLDFDTFLSQLEARVETVQAGR